MTLLILIVIPFVASLLSFLVGKMRGALEVIAGCAVLAECVVAALAIGGVITDSGVSFLNILSLDSLSALVLSTVVIVACAGAFYSIGYFREEMAKGYIDLKRVKLFYCLFHLFVGAMLTAISASSPIVMWIFLEGTTLASVFLISLYNKPSAIEAAWKYLVITSIGLLLGFFGTLLFFTSVSADQGFVSWQALLSSASSLNPTIAKIAFIFTLIGYGTKVGLAPMHTWLPDAHSKAPAPISALLSGALLNVAMLAVIRFFTITSAAIGPEFPQRLLLAFGILSLGVAAFIILVQKKYKRLFAYSSIEHMGIIALGFGIGGVASYAALLHMIYHSLAKSMLFFSAGNIFLKYGFTKISNVRGLLSVAPITAGFLFVGFLAITGVPPFGTFITEFSILSAGMESHPLLALLALIFLALIFVGFLRHIMAMVFGDAPEAVAKGEMNMFTLAPLVVVGGILSWVSISVPSFLNVLLVTASSLLH